MKVELHILIIMAIDVEARELNVDFSDLRVNVLAVENNLPNYRIDCERIRSVIFENDCFLLGRIVDLDGMYIYKELRILVISALP